MDDYTCACGYDAVTTEELASAKGFTVVDYLPGRRVVNGGGYVTREYSIGGGRIDLLVRKRYGDHQDQREAIELKVWRTKRADP